jgi:hypothetical protein
MMPNSSDPELEQPDGTVPKSKINSKVDVIKPIACFKQKIEVALLSFLDIH